MTSLVTYEPYVDECISLFRQRLVELAQAGAPVDMGHWMQCYAFDVIGMMTYSKRLGFLDHGEDVGGVIHALEGFLLYASLAGLGPSLHPFVARFKNWLAGNKGAGRAYIANFTQQRMTEQRANPKTAVIDDDENQTSELDFLSKFYSKHTKDPKNFTNYHVIAGCTQNMVAGYDTTAITLSACLYYLLKNPRVFAKLRDEVDRLDRQNGVLKGVSFKESQEMPYLQAVIKEALRVHPATGLPLERVVPKGGVTICGQYFPEGVSIQQQRPPNSPFVFACKIVTLMTQAIVGVNSWVEHRNPRIWGDDSNEFKPERWLIDDKEKLSYLNRHWMPVSAIYLQNDILQTRNILLSSEHSSVLVRECA